MRQIFLIIFCFVLIGRSLGVEFDYFTKFQKLGTEQGLPHVHVNSVFQDHLGYLWFGTHAGFVMYDGANMTTIYEEHDSTAISSQSFLHFAEHIDGNIYASSGEFLYKVDRKNLLAKNISEEIVYQSVKSMTTYHDSLIVLCKDQLWINANPENYLFQPYKLDTLSNSFGLKVLGDSLLMLHEQGIASIEVVGDSLSITPNTKIKELIDIHLSNDSTLWFISKRGVGIIEDGKPSLCIKSGGINSITSDRLNRVLVGTKNNGVFQVVKKRGKYELVSFEDREKVYVPGFFDNIINTLFCDYSGAIWIGTGGNGITKVSCDNLKYIHLRHDTTDYVREYGYVNSIGEDEKGGLWAGSSGGGLHRLDLIQKKLVNVPVIKDGEVWKNLYVQSVFFEKDTVWLGGRSEGLFMCEFSPTGDSLIVFNYVVPGNGRFRSIDRILRKNNRLVFIDSKGSVSVKQDSNMVNLEYIDVLNEHNRIDSFEVGRDRIHNPKTNSTIYGNHACIAKNGAIYLGRNDGLYQLNVKTQALDELKLGETKEAVTSVSESQNGILWLGTREGLIRYNPKNKSVLRYKFPGNENLNSFNHAIVKETKSGYLLYGCNDGVILLNPNFKSIIPTPKYQISKVIAGGEQAVWKVSNLSYNFNEKNKIAYLVNDKSTKWNTLNKTLGLLAFNPSFFTNDHLKIKVFNAAGIESTEVFETEIIRRFNLWVIALVILSMGVIWYLYLKQVQRGKLAMVSESNPDVNGEEEDDDRSLKEEKTPFVVKTEEIILSNISDSTFSVNDLYEAMQMSKSSFYRKLKNDTDMSPNEFIRNVRLECASELLKRGEQSINDIAYEVGFSSPSYFTKCFKKNYGISPKDYK
ncbi:AraC family transcriptional regulator [Puteibacter caeruleilacunae]|nr:AraC family transcriptional regulator [Puteibacter caeruleilacunae]